MNLNQIANYAIMGLLKERILMEEILELIKNTDEFGKYVSIVESYKSTVTTNAYILSKNDDVATAMLENAEIEKSEDGISINLRNIINDLSHQGELTGSAKYNAVIKSVNNDLILNGNIDARFTNFDNSMFDVRGASQAINEEILVQEFENKFIGKAELYPSKTK